MLVATLMCNLVLVMMSVSVAATMHIGEGVFVVGHSNHVVVGKHITAVGQQITYVFIAVILNGIIYGLLNSQYVLRCGTDVLQAIKVQVFSMIGGISRTQDVVTTMIIVDVIDRKDTPFVHVYSGVVSKMLPNT